MSLSIELAIKKYLADRGIRQSFVSEKCGFTKQKMYAITSGKQKVTADEYGLICEAVGVPYDYFYNAVSENNVL